MSNKLIKAEKKSSKKVNEYVEFYNSIGKAFIGCGLVSFLILGFVSLLPQDYDKYNIPLFFGIWALFSVILIVIGIIPILLGKYSKKYQVWVEKEVRSYNKKSDERLLKQGEKLIEKDEKRDLKRNK